jgi:hypothetical protein
MSLGMLAEVLIARKRNSLRKLYNEKSISAKTQGNEALRPN